LGRGILLERREERILPVRLSRAHVPLTSFTLAGSDEAVIQAQVHYDHESGNSHVASSADYWVFRRVNIEYHCLAPSSNSTVYATPSNTTQNLPR